MSIWNLEMKSICAQSRLSYRPPLPKKKQRVQAKPEKNGSVKVYSEEEKLLYLIKKFALDAKKICLPT